jgi:hypothetical protein
MILSKPWIGMYKKYVIYGREHPYFAQFVEMLISGEIKHTTQ